MSEQFAVRPPQDSPGWRPKLGLALLILAVVSPLLVPVVLTSDLPKEVRGALGGLLLFGVPITLMLTVAALVGQPAFQFLKRLIAGKDALPAPVSLTRHRVGLMFVITDILVSWIEPLVSPNFPEIAAQRVLIGALANGMGLIGLFVLGGEFWDKLHALLVYDARVVRVAKGGAAASAEDVQVGPRFYVGVAVLSCTVFSWGLLPLASAAGWSTAKVASLSAGIFVANKVLLIAAIAIMGKPGFNYLKKLLFGFFRKFGPAQHVSRSRYRLGLILFIVPMMMTWVDPYVAGLLGSGSVYGFLREMSLEILLLIGLVMLGGEFWDKLRALFKHGAKVEIIPQA